MNRQVRANIINNKIFLQKNISLIYTHMYLSSDPWKCTEGEGGGGQKQNILWVHVCGLYILIQMLTIFYAA